LLLFSFSHSPAHPRDPHSFPTRRSSDLRRTLILRVRGAGGDAEMSLAWLSVAEWKALLREEGLVVAAVYGWFDRTPWRGGEDSRSEEHTSELQSRVDLVCRLLLEKKKT